MPAALDWLVCATPVAEFDRVTLAFGMTALEASCTVPRTTPRPVCAAIGRTTKASAKKNFILYAKELCGPIYHPFSPPQRLLNFGQHYPKSRTLSIADSADS